MATLPRRLLHLALVLALTLMAAAAREDPPPAVSTPPHIDHIQPSSSPKMVQTLMWIRGNNLGLSPDDVLDVTFGGVSCRDTLVYTDSLQIACVVDYRKVYKQRPAKDQAAVAGDVALPIVVTTATGGSSVVNPLFTFQDDCLVYSSLTKCNDAHRVVGASCKWCHQASRCLPLDQSCPFPCSPNGLRITCYELGSITILSVIIFSICVATLAFAIKESQYLAEKKRRRALARKKGAHTHGGAPAHGTAASAAGWTINGIWRRGPTQASAATIAPDSPLAHGQDGGRPSAGGDPRAGGVSPDIENEDAIFAGIGAPSLTSSHYHHRSAPRDVSSSAHGGGPGTVATPVATGNRHTSTIGPFPASVNGIRSFTNLPGIPAATGSALDDGDDSDDGEITSFNFLGS
ncbi:hypothetical protein H696_00946 [Fonticula alba]|uniref:IPT/TIG domain-containing protein n=1 Tax=Fonticula alba TaxID=691883 RepID=A0A058ZGB0_FONAL|nr:hypothetical protein H696_00946 [Fonticula alba]KCV73409.1 hypothetical protein H696_00946 [Fonticula alba]|eukprot:XP_009493110.1 hypothetical protein H696_00946 [Fonticula alba]